MILHVGEQCLNAAVRLVGQKVELLTEHLLQECLLARLQAAGHTVLHDLATVQLVAGLATETLRVMLVKIAASA